MTCSEVADLMEKGAAHPNFRESHNVFFSTFSEGVYLCAWGAAVFAFLDFNEVNTDDFFHGPTSGSPFTAIEKTFGIDYRIIEAVNTKHSLGESILDVIKWLRQQDAEQLTSMGILTTQGETNGEKSESEFNELPTHSGTEGRGTEILSPRDEDERSNLSTPTDADEL